MGGRITTPFLSTVVGILIIYALQNRGLFTKAEQGSNAVPDPNNSNNVILTKFSLLVEGRDEVSIDLTESKQEYKEPFAMKEGAFYKLKIYFSVQTEIVSGLTYHQKFVKGRSGKTSERLSELMGSYGPKPELQSYTSREQEAPAGMFFRGLYNCSSKVTDDNDIVYGNWQWHLDVKKDW